MRVLKANIRIYFFSFIYRPNPVGSILNFGLNAILSKIHHRQRGILFGCSRRGVEFEFVVIIVGRIAIENQQS